MSESREVLRAKELLWDKKYQKFHDEVLEYELDTNGKLSLHNYFVFMIYGVICLLWNRFLLGKPIWGAYVCFGISAFSLANFILCKVFLEDNIKYVVIATNVYILLLISFIMSFDMIWNDFHGGNVSWTILVCSIITTSMISIVPHQYAIVVLLMVVIDTVEAIILCPNAIEVLYNLLDSVIVAIFCIGINIIFSWHQYKEFIRKDELKLENSRDGLTKLYNRRYIERYYSLHAEHDKLCAMIMLDLDNFKEANDIFGHDKGDWVLCQTGDILRRCFRDSDCIARLGGDEFAIFLYGITDREWLMERTKKVLSEFPIVLDDNARVEVKVSIGIAFKNSGENIEYSKLCKKADEAMYMAKRMGKGKAVISPEWNKREIVIVA